MRPELPIDLKWNNFLRHVAPRHSFDTDSFQQRLRSLHLPGSGNKFHLYDFRNCFLPSSTIAEQDSKLHSATAVKRYDGRYTIRKTRSTIGVPPSVCFQDWVDFFHQLQHLWAFPLPASYPFPFTIDAEWNWFPLVCMLCNVWVLEPDSSLQ